MLVNFDAGYVLAGVTALVWGLAVIPIKSARTRGMTGIAMSLPAGLLALIPVVWVFGVQGLLQVDLWSRTGFYLLLSGIAQFPLATILYYEAIRRAEVSTVIPLVNVKSAIVIVCVALMGIEPFTLRIITAGAVGMAGAVLISRRSRHFDTAQTRGHRVGVLFGALAGASWALGDLAIRPALGHVSALTAVVVALVMGTLVYYGQALARGQWRGILRMPRRDKWLYASHGVLSFGIGYFALFAAIARIGVVRAGLISAAYPAISFVIGIVLYRERLTLAKGLGFVLLMASAALAMVF